MDTTTLGDEDYYARAEEWPADAGRDDLVRALLDLIDADTVIDDTDPEHSYSGILGTLAGRALCSLAGVTADPLTADNAALDLLADLADYLDLGADDAVTPRRVIDSLDLRASVRLVVADSLRTVERVAIDGAAAAGRHGDRYRSANLAYAARHARTLAGHRDGLAVRVRRLLGDLLDKRRDVLAVHAVLALRGPEWAEPGRPLADEQAAREATTEARAMFAAAADEDTEAGAIARAVLALCADLDALRQDADDLADLVADLAAPTAAITDALDLPPRTPADLLTGSVDALAPPRTVCAVTGGHRDRNAQRVPITHREQDRQT